MLVSSCEKRIVCAKVVKNYDLGLILGLELVLGLRSVVAAALSVTIVR